MNISNRLRTILIIICVAIEVLIVAIVAIKKDPTATAYFAKEDIEAYTIITEDMLETKTISKDSLNAMFPNAATKASDLIGCITKTEIEAGTLMELDEDTLVMGNELHYALDKNGDVNYDYFITGDERLVTISVDSVGSLNYSIKKDDCVDVIYSSTENATGGLYSSVLLQGMRVFDVEDVISESDSTISKKQNITLIATQEEAIILVAGNRNGTLNLALNPSSGTREYVEPVSILSFVPDSDSSKSEVLESLYSYVESADMTDTNKEKILNALTDEEGREALVEMILTADIDEATKNQLLITLVGEGE